MGEEFISIADHLFPRKMRGVVDEPLDQVFPSPDRAGHKLPCQLLLFQPVNMLSNTASA